MGNETNPSPAPEEAVPSRVLFHLQLGATFIPFAPVLLGAALAIAGGLSPAETRLQKQWRTLLLALVAADVLVALCMVWMLANPERLERPRKEADKPRLGISFNSDPETGEPRIDQVLPGSPAEKAGLQPGDLIERIDGDSVSTRKQVFETITSGAAGVERKLEVRRGDSLLEISAAPQLPERKSEGLFKARPSPGRPDWLGAIVGFVPAAALVALLAFLSRRGSQVRIVVWRGFLLASVGSFAASIGAAMLMRSIQGGSSIGGFLIALLAQMATLVGLTWIATRWCGKEVPPPTDPLPPLSRPRAALLGIFYLITGFPRASILLFTADQIFFQGSQAAKTQSLEILAGSPLGVWGTLLFVFVVVFLGPFAEESLFRGFLVPRLAAKWGSLASIVVSSILFALFHPHYGLFVPVVFLYSYVFGWARLRTRGIAVPALLHMMVNGLVTTIMLLRN